MFSYQPNRKHSHAVDYFEGFTGYLHCDGYQAYDTLSSLNSGVTQVGCWYHVRRKFVEAANVGGQPGIAQEVVKQIGKLSRLEKQCQLRGYTPTQIKAYRQAHAPELIKTLKQTLEQVKDTTPPKSLLGKAIDYALRQWPKLLTYLEDGRLDISNNRTERAIKPFALSRKNWLFADSVQGANAAAIIFSLIETCKAHQVNPYQWMRMALTRLPLCQTVEDFEALLPFHCKKALDIFK